jgi:hypothetical protein
MHFKIWTKKSNLNIFKNVTKENQKINWKEKGKKKTEKRKKEKEQKKKKEQKNIADQVGANGPAHTARGGVRRGASADLVGA